MWITICFNTNFDFDRPLYNITYDGYAIEVKRGSLEEGHNLYIETSEERYKDAHETGRRFLSEVSWLFKCEVEVLTFGASGHKLPVNVANRKFNRVGGGINLDDYKQLTFEKSKRLSISLYREAISSNSQFYKFLGFFKIINLTEGKEQKRWINNNIHKIMENKDRLQKLIDQGIENFGDHLYHSGRCAIAHASINSEEPVADADNYDDNYRIGMELPIIRELAEIYIKNDLKVPDRNKAFKNITYNGLIKIFGNHLITKILFSQKDCSSDIQSIFKLSLSIFEDERIYNYLKGLNFKVIRASKGLILISNRSHNTPIIVQFMINLLEREISFDIDHFQLNQGIHLNNNIKLDYYYFLKSLLFNGRIEIYHEKNFILRLSPYIPINIDFEATLKEIEHSINKLEKG